MTKNNLIADNSDIKEANHNNEGNLVNESKNGLEGENSKMSMNESNSSKMSLKESNKSKKSMNEMMLRESVEE